MALVKCPDCGKMVSPRAEKCPECGCPAKYFNMPYEKPIEALSKDKIPEKQVITNDESGQVSKDGQGQNESIFCVFCGKRIQRKAKFCNFCGKGNPLLES